MRKAKGGEPPAIASDPEWNDLAVFLVIAETGSLTKAAERLKTTQPTVSKRLDSLEERLGATLAIRTLSGVTLTSEGVVVADHAASMSRLVRQITTSVSMRDRAVEGKVSIVCPDALAVYVLAPALADFQRAFPGISIELRARRDQNEEPDISIQFVETKRMDDVAIPLGWQHYATFAAQSYLDLYDAPHALTDAFQHRVIMHLDHVHQSERWTDKARALQDMLDPAGTTDSGVFMVRAVCEGAGVAALPTYIAHHEPRLIMLGSGEYARARFWLVFDRAKGEAARVRQAIDWLKGVFESKRNPWFWEEFVEPKDFTRLLGTGR